MVAFPLDRRTFLAAALSATMGPSLLAKQEVNRRQKKGFCITVRDGSRWQQKLKALNASWFYCWNAQVPEGVPAGVEFCPMIWGGAGKNVEKKCRTMAGLVAAKEVQHVMGFNEPDQPDQSDLSVEQAVKWWPRLMELGVPLVSPGCVHPDRDWMQEFMAEVERRNYRVDFVAVHTYGGRNLEALMRRLRGVHETFGRPLWITELAVADWNATNIERNHHSPDAVAQYMRQLLPALEAADFVDRYAWFSASPDHAALGSSALFTDEGHLTPLGEIYSEHSVG